VKPQIQRLLTQEEAKRRANYRNMEHNIYECIYDILRSIALATVSFTDLQRYKAKLVRLLAARKSKILLDIREKDKLENEEPSLFHFVRIRWRRAAREFTQVTDLQCITHTTPSGTVANFVSHLSNKYKPIDVDESFMATLRNFIRPVCPTPYTCYWNNPSPMTNLP
jgi:hypothetical protein